MSVAHLALRREIVATARRMNAAIGNPGTSGNVSARAGKGFLVTPSGFPYDEMTPRDVVAMDFAGKATGRHAPSTEWPFHAAILAARPVVEHLCGVYLRACAVGEPALLTAGEMAEALAKFATYGRRVPAPRAPRRRAR